MELEKNRNQRIFELLERGIKKPVILIEAAPRYGKSKLVRQFLEEKVNNYGWLRLRQMDNWLFFTWKQLLRELSRILPDHSDDFNQLETPGTIGQIAELIELMDRSLMHTERSVLVIDDYSIVRNEYVRFFYESLVEADLPNLCIIIISSQKTNFIEICNKSQVDYLAIDEELLSYTASDTQQLFNRYNISTTLDQARAITDKWQGWPMPISILASSSQSIEEALSNPLDKIHQLFFTQFYDRYTKELQKHLIQMSLLEGIPAELLEEIDPKERAIIDGHPFINYDFKNNVYSFHSGYNDFLRGRQSLLTEEEKQAIILPSAEIFLQRGKLEDALPLYIQCQGYDQAVELVWQMLEPFVDYSKIRFLYSYINQLPQEYLTAHPRAQLQIVSLLFFMAETKNINNMLHSLINQLKKNKNPDIEALGEAYYLLAQMARMTGDERFLEYTRLASLYLPNGSRYWGDYLGVLLKATWTRFPYYKEELANPMEHARKIFDTLNPYMTIILKGKNIQVDKFCAMEIDYYTYNLKGARMHLLEFLHTAEREQMDESILLAHHFMMRIELLEGHLGKAEKQIEEVKRIIQERKLYQLNGVYSRMKSMLALYLHKPEDVSIRITKNSFEKGAKWELIRNGFVQARYLIEINKCTEALALLNYLDKVYGMYKGLWVNTTNVKIFRAITYLKIGERERAINDLKAAYDLTYGNGIITQFIDFEQSMRHMIQVVREDAPEKFDEKWCDLIYTKSNSLAKRVLRLRKQVDANEKKIILTPRRLEVLTDLAIGLTAEEIARHRHISVNTVKTHVKNIYNDLGATNRADAIRIAMENGIVK